MRGRRAALAIANLTWASLKTLHEHTIINHREPNRRMKTQMNSITLKKPLHPRQDRRKPRETSRRGSGAGPVCAARVNKELRCKSSPHPPPPYRRPMLSCADHEGEYIGGPKLTFDLMGQRLYISGQPSFAIRRRLSSSSEPLQSAWTPRGSLAIPRHCNRTEFETTARMRLVRKSQVILQLTPAAGRDCRRNE